MLIMKQYLLLIICFPFLSLFAQQNKGRWTDMFSYANVKFIEEVQDVLYCATENGIFIYDNSSTDNEWVKYNKTNILSNVGISAMDYEPSTNTLVVGYESGAIDLLEAGKSSIVLDIPWNNFSGSKRVNHISISGDIAIISGNFGIASFSISEKEFKETTFFYKNSNYLSVNEAAIFNGNIYAATSDGVYTYPLVNNVNYPNFYEWKIQPSTQGQNVLNLELFNNELYYSTKNQLYKINATNQTTSILNLEEIIDLKSNKDKLAITDKSGITFIDTNQSTSKKIIKYQDSNSQGNIQEYIMEMNTGIYFNNKYYGGSMKFGLVDFDLVTTYYTEPKGYLPDGPYNNLSYSLAVKNNKVWIAPGGIGDFNQPLENSDGFYYFDKYIWKHFKSNQFENAKDFVKIAVDPNDDNHFVAVPYFEATNWNYTQKIGVMEVNLKDNSYNYNHIISPLKWRYRIASAAFDESGNLYLGSSFPEINGTTVYNSNYYYQRKGNTWKNILSQKGNLSTTLSPDFSNDYIWFPNARNGGVTVLDKEMNEIITLTQSNANLYEDNVISLAVDQNNSVWIGTLLGITVLNNADASIASGNYKTEPIVIIQDGIPEALLTSIRINDIKVDKANRKWIATNSSGVYYVSDNGEQTIHHFTSKNSPLPSDIVYDIEIDDSNGKVYFATDKGVVVFNGDVQDVGTNFNQALAYPNPVRPSFKGNVIIKNLPNRASVKITDVVGNLIYETKANGGIVEWNTRNSKGKEVASGVYLVLMSNDDGTETKTLKIAVVR